MGKHTQLATEVLAAVGGKENVQTVTHCMTRLRFVLYDDKKASDDILKAIQGVISVVRAGGQVQVVIGTTVDMVYDEVCKIGGFTAQDTVKENPDEASAKRTPKDIVNNVMAYISGSITPVLPVFIVAGIFKMVAVLLGPKNFGVLADTSDLYRICDLVSTAGYYYLPFFIAYSASKKLGSNPILPILMAGIMLHPTMLEIVGSGDAFRVFGIPMPSVSYVQAVFPVLIIVWAMSLIEKGVKKIVPNALRVVGVPVLTMIIALPVSLCVLGPVCSVVMGYISQAVLWMNNTIGVPTIVIVSALWPFIVMFGMHVPIMTALLPTWMEMGYDAIVSPATLASGIAGFGVAVGYALRAKNKDDRSLGWSTVAPYLTNISEPFLYGIMLRNRKALVYSAVGAAIGGCAMGILGAKVTMFSGVGLIFLGFLRFGEYAAAGAIGLLVAFGVSLALSIIFGFEEKNK